MRNKKGQFTKGYNSIKKNGKYVKCEMCKKEFYLAKWEIKKGRKYCSLKCQTEGKKNKKHSIGHSKKISESNKGRIFSEEHRKKLSLINTGKKYTKETKEKIRQANLKEKNPNWKDGSSEYGYNRDWNDLLKEAIRLRDNYVCQECGIHQDELIGRFKKLDVHHIDYDKYNCDPDNLISLCRTCHMKTNFNREEWKKYFNNLINLIIVI